MKRGFLLNAQEKKAAAAKKRAQNADGNSKHITQIPNTNGGQSIYKLSYGNLTTEDKALPTDYDATKGKYAPIEIDPLRTEFEQNVILTTTIPQPVDNGEPQSEWIVHGPTKAKVLHAPGYPAPIPKPHRPDLYEVRSTPDMGIGVFAKRNIKRGALILVERPLLVSPRGVIGFNGAGYGHYTPEQARQVSMYEFEQLLEFSVGRMSKESQADFMALHNSHKNDGSGPILGIIRTNCYGIDILYDGTDEESCYTAVCKIGSRINHSCIPNINYWFKRSSFSVQFYAKRDIEAGEQLFFTYCTPNSTVAERRADLEPYGFVCTCQACVNATPESDNLRKNFVARVKNIEQMAQNEPSLSSPLEMALKLEDEMIKEGLDSTFEFLRLLIAITFMCMMLGKMAEREKYGGLVEAHKRSHASSE